MINLPQAITDTVTIADHSSDGWTRARVKCSNGYSLSIVHHPLYSYGGEEGLCECAVLDTSGHITYDTHITDDVIGHCDKAKVLEILKQVQAL